METKIQKLPKVCKLAGRERICKLFEVFANFHGWVGMCQAPPPTPEENLHVQTLNYVPYALIQL